MRATRAAGRLLAVRRQRPGRGRPPERAHARVVKAAGAQRVLLALRLLLLELLRLLILKWWLLAHGDPELVAVTPAPPRQVGGNQPPRLAIVGSREARGELADALPCGVH